MFKEPKGNFEEDKLNKGKAPRMFCFVDWRIWVEVDALFMKGPLVVLAQQVKLPPFPQFFWNLH